jgi:NTE family protein
VTKTVGLALGGGGAKGLAHIAILETLESMGVVPKVISGTSIGAMVGSLYASGMTAKQVRSAVDELLEMPGSIGEAFDAKRAFGWLELLSLQVRRSHLFDAQALIEELDQLMGVSQFEQLKIPMKVIAADFWQRKEVVFETGDLLPAIAASFCLPGIFEPVVIGDKVLVDGGMVNPVPFDVIRQDCDIVVAVDVLGKRYPDGDQLPTYFEALFNSFQIAEKSISMEKMKHNAPDIFIEPEIVDVKMLEFHKSEQIYQQCAPACRHLESELTRLLA